MDGPSFPMQIFTIFAFVGVICIEHTTTGTHTRLAVDCVYVYGESNRWADVAEEKYRLHFRVLVKIMREQ